MKPIRRILPAAVFVIALALAAQIGAKPVPKTPDKALAKDDKAQLQGAWLWISVNGAKVSDDDPKSKVATTTFQGDKAIVKVNGKPTQEATFRLDPTKKPKEIDLVILQGGQELILKGIYQLDGDDLKLSHVGPDVKRPVAFTSGVMLLKRIKS